MFHAYWCNYFYYGLFSKSCCNCATFKSQHKYELIDTADICLAPELIEIAGIYLAPGEVQKPKWMASSIIK